MSFSAARLALLLLSGVISLQAAEYVPVLMWGATAEPAARTRALSRLNADKFSDILADQLDSGPFTVAFVEETLSVEDLMGKDSRGRTPYPGLREKATGDSLLYLPAVGGALRSLERMAGDRLDRVRLTAEGLSADVHAGAGRMLLVSLQDAREGEDRLHMLSRHDQFMTEMFDKLLKKHDNVLAIYTARYPSWEVAPSQDRSRRHLMANEDTEPSVQVFSLGQVLVYFTNIAYRSTDTGNLTTISTNGTGTLTMNETNYVEAKMDFNADSLTIGFIQEVDGYWYMVNASAVLEGTTHDMKTQDVYGAKGFSYHCSPDLTLNALIGEAKVVLSNFQAQPFFGEAESRFSLAYDCVGFTSVPIWSGLFVVSLLIAITFGGVLMMLDVRTMDRFDDPKGKTITINAQE